MSYYVLSHIEGHGTTTKIVLCKVLHPKDPISTTYKNSENYVITVHRLSGKVKSGLHRPRVKHKNDGGL